MDDKVGQGQGEEQGGGFGGFGGFGGGSSEVSLNLMLFKGYVSSEAVATLANHVHVHVRMLAL